MISASLMVWAEVDQVSEGVGVAPVVVVLLASRVGRWLQQVKWEELRLLLGQCLQPRGTRLRAT